MTAARPAACLAALAIMAAGCGSSDSSSTGGGSDSTSTGDGVEDSSSKTGQVRVVWQEPESEEDQIGYESLQAAETEAVARELAEEFELPHPLLVRGVNGYEEGPFYLGEDNSITLPYGFSALVLEVLAEADPESSEAELEEQATGVNSFILAHEFAHALIENFELPVLGKEEDAADSISTALLLEVPAGTNTRPTRRSSGRGCRGNRKRTASPNTPIPIRSTSSARTTSSAGWPARAKRPMKKSPNSKSCPPRGWKPVPTNTNSS